MKATKMREEDIDRASDSREERLGVNGSTEKLLRFLCTAISRDGGASLVTSLKDHYWTCSPKRLNNLLVESPIGKPKLLRFLEHFHDIFQVDRDATPHWVLLRDKARDYLDEDAQAQQVPTAAQALIDKTQYILRRRHSRLARRANNDIPNHPAAYQVNVQWLVKECIWELHFYLRATDFYRAVYSSPQQVFPVRTKQWQELVAQPFMDFLMDSPLVQGDRELSKVWLKEHVLTSQPKPEISQKPTLNTDLVIDPDWLDQLERQLTKLVRQDGATKVLLGLLLHRNAQLKQLLGGRDLWEIAQQHPERFEDLEVTQMDGDLVLKTKQNPQLESLSATGLPLRMKVDTVGLFSVTNSKWSKAIANIMIQTCQQQGYDLSSTTAVDLTASVGGMTLGMAKANRFQNIIALEIDETRAKLCQQNMQQHGVADRVQVRNEDSVQAIPTLPNRSCILIDPPWGGEHYKQKFKQQPPLQMGPWTLEQVLQRIAHNIPDCIVGLRLPVTLLVETFLERLKTDCSLQFHTLIIRKLSVQLMLVIRFTTKDADITNDV